MQRISFKHSNTRNLMGNCSLYNNVFNDDFQSRKSGRNNLNQRSFV